MANSFDPTLPTSKDSARSILRDINAGDWILADEEINANLANNGWNDGIALCATSMAAEFARRASKYKAGSTDAEFDYSERISFYENLAGLARRGAIAPPSPSVRPVAAPESTEYARKRCVRNELI